MSSTQDQQKEMKSERSKEMSVNVIRGKSYYLCSCGLSKNAFCDGSHKDTEFKPVKFVAEETATLTLCGCSKSAKAPFCDASQVEFA